jgi:hypothetical protein
MAIAFDNATDGNINNGTSLTFSHTCSGSNRFLKVSIKLYGANDITGVTYNGVAMSHIATAVQGTEGSRAVMYGLIAPATGANNVVISRTSSNFIAGSAESYTGVSQSGQPEASGTDFDTAAQTTPTATVTSSNAWLVGSGSAAFAGAPWVGYSGTVVRIDNASFQGIQGSFDSNGTVSTGSQSLSFGLDGNSGADLAGVVAVLAPFGAAALDDYDWQIQHPQPDRSPVKILAY